jgi:hypothetical protein
MKSLLVSELAGRFTCFNETSVADTFKQFFSLLGFYLLVTPSVYVGGV